RPRPELARQSSRCRSVSSRTADTPTMTWAKNQLAAALHCGALICAALAVSALPRRAGLRPRHGPVLITVASVPAFLIGLYPVYSADDPIALLHPATPGLLALAAAVALTVLTVTRTAGGRPRTAALVGGGLLALVPALAAVQEVVTPIMQLRYLTPDPEPGYLTIRGCVYSYSTPDTSLTAVALTAGGILLVLAAPALLVWASPRPPR
ncbi:hypothetical protein, partial [Actinoplanes philippinensis]|uniref:hypothetical protein n=1 Tax=Actinoplanes philippinensis TaxID=35752 RepID=UPI0033FC2EEA